MGLEDLRTKPLVGVYHWPCGLKKMPLIGDLYLVQLTLTSKGLSDVPLLGGLCHVQRTSTTKGLNDLPLIGGHCLMQWTLTTKGPMICPSSEDFVSCNGLQPPRVSMICPHRRTLSHATDFDRNGLNDLPLIGGLCLIPMTDFDHDRSQVTNRNKPKGTAAQTMHQENALP
jgi:hypothetical protein